MFVSGHSPLNSRCRVFVVNYVTRVVRTFSTARAAENVEQEVLTSKGELLLALWLTADHGELWSFG